MQTLMGWVLVTLIACILLVTTSVVFTYLNVSNKFRIIYIVITAVVVWVLYMLSVYFVVFRPLKKCIAELKEGKVHSDILLFREELNEVNRVVKTVHVAKKAIENDVNKLKMYRFQGKMNQ